MKIEAIHQLEKELQWIFTYVPWRHPERRQRAVEWTKNFLKNFRREAQGVAISSEAMQAHGLTCSFCGHSLPLASTSKRRFCSARCNKRDQRRRRKRPDTNPNPRHPQPLARRSMDSSSLNRDFFCGGLIEPDHTAPVENTACNPGLRIKKSGGKER